MEARKWLGKDDRFEHKVDQFFHRLEMYGGAMCTGYRPTYDVICPDDGEEFIRSQYERFGITIPIGAEFLYRYGVALIMDYIDYLDPYLLFWEWSDVRITNDWANYKYQLLDRNNVAHECCYDDLETFAIQPGAAEEFFNHYIVRPGFDALPEALRYGTREFHSEIMSGDRCLGRWDETEQMDVEVLRTHAALADVCLLPNGLVDHDRLNAYYDLSIWAGILWFFGPLGREWRKSISDVTEACMQYGECILYQGDVYTPDRYRKVDAMPGSCEECGVGAYCVEKVYFSAGWAIDACERCASVGMPNLGFGTCGKRLCRYTECIHNPFHSQGASGIHNAHRHGGQLMARAEERRRVDGVMAPSESFFLGDASRK